MEEMVKMEIKKVIERLTMKKKLMLWMLFGLISISFTSAIACDTQEQVPEEVKTSESGRAQDGESGASGTLTANGQNGEHGQKGKKGRDGGNGGKGGNSWWGRAGDGGNGGDAE